MNFLPDNYSNEEFYNLFLFTFSFILAFYTLRELIFLTSRFLEIIDEFSKSLIDVLEAFFREINMGIDQIVINEVD